MNIPLIKESGQYQILGVEFHQRFMAKSTTRFVMRAFALSVNHSANYMEILSLKSSAILFRGDWRKLLKLFNEWRKKKNANQKL